MSPAGNSLSPQAIKSRGGKWYCSIQRLDSPAPRAPDGVPITFYLISTRNRSALGGRNAEAISFRLIGRRDGLQVYGSSRLLLSHQIRRERTWSSVRLKKVRRIGCTPNRGPLNG